MYGNQIVPFLKTKVRQPDSFYPDIRRSPVFSSFLKSAKIPKKENNLTADMYNLTLQKTAQSLVLSGITYSPSQTPTLGNLIYTPSTIKVEVKKLGLPVNNSRVYLFDMNMVCVAQTVTDIDGTAYFYNKPLNYHYHVVSEESTGHYVSTIVNRLQGVEG